jgi:hypothetical protein
MTAHLDHLRRQDARGAVQGREGLVELRHVSADGGLPLNQDSPKPFIGNLQRCLHSRDAAPDDEGYWDAVMFPFCRHLSHGVISKVKIQMTNKTGISNAKIQMPKKECKISKPTFKNPNAKIQITKMIPLFEI